MTVATAKAPPAATAIGPFAKIEFPEAELKELRARIEATHWPEKETVKPVEPLLALPQSSRDIVRNIGPRYDGEARCFYAAKFLRGIE